MTTQYDPVLKGSCSTSEFFANGWSDISERLVPFADYSSISPKMRCRLLTALSAQDGCAVRLEQARQTSLCLGFNRLEIDANRRGDSLDAGAEKMLALALKVDSRHGHIEADDFRYFVQAGFARKMIIDVICFVATARFSR